MIKGISAKELIKYHQTNQKEFKTYQAKVKIDFIEDLKEQSYTVNLRMEKDKAIWINATFGLARAMITPEKVQFYDKINNQYFDGDYALLSDLLGVPLDFTKVQNLLLGHSIFDLSARDFKVSNNEASYILQPKSQDPLIELILLVNPSHFKMDSQQLYQQSKKRFLQVDYEAYQEVQKQILPERLKIIAVENSDEVNIKMEFKSVSLNEEVRFPFTIPDGFEEIVLDDAK